MKRWALVGVIIGIGAANAVVFKGFEAVIKHGGELIWNDWLQTDSRRWLVVPVALVFSVLFSLILRWMRQPRWIKPEVNIHLGEAGGPPATLATIGSVLFVGATGLLAGASLGPEMPLAQSSTAIGSWAAGKFSGVKAAAGVKASEHATALSSLLVAASVGALLVAFLGSMLMVILPLLIIYQENKRFVWPAMGLVVLAGLSSYAALWLMGSPAHGFGTIPAEAPAVTHDYLGAVIIALCVSMLGWWLVQLIKRFGDYTRRLDIELPWYVSAAWFGAVLGGLYLIGGQSVQFSGSTGIGLLLGSTASYGTWAFLGLAIIKIVVTAWSKTSGYRGGLFFPSIFAGVALALFLGNLSDSFAGPGTMVGSIAAIFMALSIPDKSVVVRRDYLKAAVFAFLFMAALLPVQLMPLALLAILVAGMGNRLIVHLIGP